jgi:integrase/recombinase XerD
MKLEAAVSLFLSVDRALQTNDTYRRVMRQFIAYAGADRELETITVDELQIYISQMRNQKQKYASHPLRPVEEGRLSPATINKHVKTLKAFFRFAIKRGYLVCSPAEELKVRKYNRAADSSKAILPEELKALVAACKPDPRDYAIVLFLADTGCRVGGLASLKIGNLQLGAVSGTALLTEKGEQLHRVFFGEMTANALRVWLEYRPYTTHSFVFVSKRNQRPFSSKSVSQMVKRKAEKAGIKRPIGPHAIRHRVGQAWADEGINPELIRMKLGHSDVSITTAFYFNQDFSRLEQVSDRYPLK